MAKETLGRDFNGITDYSLPFPVAGTYATLAANTEQTITTPPNFNRVFFSYSVGTNVFVGIGDVSITIPSGSFVASTTELNPMIRQISVKGGETLRFISDSAAYVQVRYDMGQ